MILAPHIFVGAAIASRVSNPILGIVFAFLSHYLIDAIPHTDYTIEHAAQRQINFPALKEFLLAFFDIMGGLTLVYLLTSGGARDQLYLLVSGFAAALPDSLHVSRYILPARYVNLLNSGHRLHSKYKNPPMILGVLTQIGVVLIATFFLRV